MTWKAVCVTLTLCSSLSAMAQRNESRTANENKSIATQRKPVHVTLDAAPLLLGGLGASVEYQVMDRLTVGPTASFFNVKSDSSNLGLEHNVTMLGARARFFPFDYADESGVYLLGGAMLSQVKTTAAFSGTQAGTATKSGIGPQAGLGYQAVGTALTNSTDLLFNFGALYGYGYEIETEAVSVNRGPTRITGHSVRNSLYFELGIGVLF
jgi:hypothetical protein